MTQNETKIWHNSELFVEINLRKDDPNHSRTSLFVQVCAMKKIILILVSPLWYYYMSGESSTQIQGTPTYVHMSSESSVLCHSISVSPR
jgi:hypothetical protein